MSFRRVRFYDTTLRDGEQMPGVAFGVEHRIRIAQALDDAGMDEIEVGFAASGQEQQKDMARVAQLGLRARLLSLGRPLPGDIDAALAAGVDGLIMFCSVSPLHLQHKLRRSYEEVRERAESAIGRAKRAGLFVQLSIEDSTRTPIDRLQDLAQRAVAGGAERLGLADTVGVATPEGMKNMVGAVLDVVDVPVAVHCHDDFGLAVANSLAAVTAGASYLSTTVNGIGERSGNTPMEPCAVALEKLYGYKTNIDLRKLPALSRLVAECSGVPIPPNTPLMGANSFRHESGIHISAVLREPLCYEPFDPETIGRERRLAIGKTNGRAALRHLAGSRGELLDDDACRRLLQRIKQISEDRGPLDLHVLNQLIDEEIISCPSP